MPLRSSNTRNSLLSWKTTSPALSAQPLPRVQPLAASYAVRQVSSNQSWLVFGTNCTEGAMLLRRALISRKGD